MISNSPELFLILDYLGDFVAETAAGLVIDVDLREGKYRSFFSAQSVRKAVNAVAGSTDAVSEAREIAGSWASEVDNARLQHRELVPGILDALPNWSSR